MGVTMHQIPLNERPRERFLNSEISSISNEDLIAIILKNGTKGISVKSLALSILALLETLNSLDELTVEKLITIKGIGKVKAVTFLASLELGKRMANKVPVIQNKILTNSNIVYEYYKTIIGSKKQEYFYCLYLDNRKRIIKEKLLFIGTINLTTIHPREIFKEAYLVSASSIICIHNHPSGSTTPSDMDRSMTKQLILVGNLLGIPVIDHIIIGHNTYFSFFEEKEI